ncbi:MAG TPA: OsmC family protein [Candidatus Binatia bacterium]|nr:OsmC family protein [Candidatus Binatia bacterium]
MSEIASAVERARAYLTEHPDEARYRDALARARLSTGLRVEVDGPGGERLTTDMPKGIGGTATMPSPGWYFRAAAAACVASLLGIRAAMTGIYLAPNSIEVTVDTESDDRGILGLDDSIPAGALSIRVVVSASGGAPGRQQLEQLVRWAVDHCPVTDTARREVPIEVRLG